MHISVLLKETIEGLCPGKNENFIDCTLNGGGHTKEILKHNGPKGKVLGIEWDKEIFENIKKENIDRLIPVNDSYTNLKTIAQNNDFHNISGILFDLGMSSYQIDEEKKGFSFKKDEPLIMAYGEGDQSAEKIINEYPESELERIIREYGEEKFSKKIAKKIIEERKNKRIKTTFQLTEIIKKAIPKTYQYTKIHFATRTFQAIRIETNQELENIKKTLPEAIDLLAPGGKIAIISFHSLEDRIVKNYFKDQEQKKIIKISTEKPIAPTEEEIKINPRARSAKLRIAIKL
ncbi:MAG: 16S rRNA (cytosine(1402)-N(4))-methyltransferase RsmH [Candidatus Paceibacterota bacterium]